MVFLMNFFYGTFLITYIEPLNNVIFYCKALLLHYRRFNLDFLVGLEYFLKNTKYTNEKNIIHMMYMSHLIKETWFFFKSYFLKKEM